MSSIAGVQRRGPSIAEARELVARARSGDRAAFEEFYQAMHPLVVQYLRWRVPVWADSENLAAATWLRAWMALPGLRHDQNPVGWVFTIARNLAIDQAKSSTGRRETHLIGNGAQTELEQSVVDTAPGPEEQVLAAERRLALARAVGVLTDMQQRAVRARLAGLTLPEVSEAMGLPPSSVKGLWYRAFRRLRSELTSRSDFVGVSWI